MAKRKRLTPKKMVGMGVIVLVVLIALMYVRSQLSGLLGQM